MVETRGRELACAVVHGVAPRIVNRRSRRTAELRLNYPCEVPMLSIRRLLVLTVPLLSLIIAAGCAAHAQKAHNDEFHQGRALVTQGKYAEAIPLLEQFLKSQPKHKNASRAGLFLGKSHLALAEYDKATKAFESTVANYPGTLEDHKCRYKLGLVALLQNDPITARVRFEQLAQKPDGPLAAEATAMVRHLKALPAERPPE